jgi:hypothetical protein
MFYEIETLSKEEGNKKYRLWIRQERDRDVIIYLDVSEKPTVDKDTLIVKGMNKLDEFSILYFALKYRDIVEFGME